MYETNYKVLCDICNEKSVLRHVSKHRNPDGSFDVAGSLRLWNEAIARFDQIQLWEGGAPNFKPEEELQPQPSIVFVPAQNGDTPRGTVIVAHGGGFSTRTGCEGIHVAKYFTDAGFNTAILTYRLQPYNRYDAMYDMQRAIRLLRTKKEELGITDKVVAMGFSAGGMLSSNCATHFDYGNPDTEDEIERRSCRPDGAVLGYGAFTFCGLPGGFFVDPFADTTHNPFVANKDELIYFAPEVTIEETSRSQNSNRPADCLEILSLFSHSQIEEENHTSSRRGHCYPPLASPVLVAASISGMPRLVLRPERR